MPKQVVKSDNEKETVRKPTRRRARDPRQRENQLISLATDAAEEQLRNGTASSAVITHFLKLGTEKYRYENEKLARESKMLEIKADAIESQKKSEDLYQEAIAAFRSYMGAS